jgi:hypothetical protein
MSIKDLFNKGYSLKFLKDKSRDDLREDIESPRYIDSHSKKRQRFFPDVDFTTASNFARFGLAEEYYDAAIKRIYQMYPYDGSQAEKLDWENESTYLDLFIFENEYPRTNGFITMGQSSSFAGSRDSKYNIFSSSSPQYVFIKGGPHADPLGDHKSDFSAGKSIKGISKANIYHTASQRTNNLEFDMTKGVTVEFWMKKDGWGVASQDEFVFHLWNSGSIAGSALSNGALFLTSSGRNTTSKKTISTHIVSGSTEKNFSHDTGLSDIADGNWHHFAVTAKNEGTSTVSNLYVDGIHTSRQRGGAGVVGVVTGAMVASLGGCTGPLKGGGAGVTRGWGNIVSASFDEFRYWKTERDAQEIGRFYKDQVGGGTNTDNIKYDDVTNKVDLGVYYKFNEGIVGTNSTDSSILDYSGRISNGQFVNYSSGCRSTGSAIVLSNAAAREFKDPIIYSTHPDVESLISSKEKLGKAHDHGNPVSLYKSLPGWILEEDERESNHLKYLMQVLGSYFDDLFLQIEKLPKLKDINYPDDNNYEKPLPFADRLLETRGYDAPELFAHASALSKYLDRGEKKIFEKKLYEVKNIIYQNIYNNLSHIQKTKGTFKSLRNFLRCFGVDEELIKLNIYANNDVYEFKDNFSARALQKRFVDFDDAETRFTASSNHDGAYGGTIYQYKNSSQDNSTSYIPGVLGTNMTGAAMTIEAEVFFPKREFPLDPPNFSSLTSSIFGLHAIQESETDLSFASNDKINFNLVASKTVEDRRTAGFSLVTSGSSNIISDVHSEPYVGLYDNQKWNFAFRLRPIKYPISNAVQDAPDTGSTSYVYELYGNNSLSNIVQNEFTVSGTMSLANALKFFYQPKRIFAGAARKNFTGSVETPSDVKISSVRAWYSYLDDETMRAHGRDSNTYGALHPLKNANLTDQSTFLGLKIPQIKTLILNWNMDNVTGSNDNGRFVIDDFSSGSSDITSYGFLTPVLEKNYTGRGDFFVSDTNFQDQAIDVEFLQTSRQKLPEVVNSDDMVKILDKQDDVMFTRDTTYVQHLLSVEKSMYQIISEEMMRFFASVVDFNNLVGEPVNRYRPYYKKLEKARNLFFDRVEENADLEKFIEYYKWIDDAVTMMIAQLIPASANSVELLRNMIESHVLERNKYWTKQPILETRPNHPIASLKGIEELKYNWKFGHAPLPDAGSVPTNQSASCLWWKERAERTGTITSGDSSIDNQRDSILKIAVTEQSGSGPTLLVNDNAKTRYEGSYYYKRSLSRVADLAVNRPLSLKGGSNPSDNKIHDFYKVVTRWGSDDDFIYLDIDNEIKSVSCDDQEIPPELDKKKFRMKAFSMPANQTVNSTSGTSSFGVATARSNEHKYTDAKSTLILPFSIYSSSVNTGYQKLYASQFGIDFTNLHEDKYGLDATVPMQGTYTEKHVGGNQHRHINLNQGSDTKLTRAEGWHLQEFLDDSTAKSILLEPFSSSARDMTVATTDVSTLNLPFGSEEGDPSPYEYWSNGNGAENPWTFLGGGTPSAGTGPSPGVWDGFAYCEVLPTKVGQTFGLVTPLIDLLEYDAGSQVVLGFGYHMYGIHMGTLKVQASEDPSFQTGVEDLLIQWDVTGRGTGPFMGTSISGQQHGSGTDTPHTAQVTTQTAGNNGLKAWLGRRFYIRFFYTAGISHLGDIAIDLVTLGTMSPGVYRNSFKLLDPTYDNHHHPSAVLTREEYTKRPVSIKNIHMTGTSPTKAGNYLDRYEYVSTVSPEANDPYFVKNVDKISHIRLQRPATGSIEAVLSADVNESVATPVHIDYTLPDRSFLTASTRNRTRIKSRFSSPGGFETLSRGYLDPEHETYSPNNAMTFRNAWSRKVHNSQLQAHMGKFGVSNHSQLTGSVVTLAVADGDGSLPAIASEKDYIDIISTDGTYRRYLLTNAVADGSTSTGTVLEAGSDTGASTAGSANAGAIAVSVNLTAGTQNTLLATLKLAIERAVGHGDKIIVGDAPGAVDGRRTLTLQRSTSDESLSVVTNIDQLQITGSFIRGVNPTARVYGSEAQGAINSDNFGLAFGDAAAHKYHRNNLERIKFAGDSPTSNNSSFFTSSIHDNAFVSHMIPRTDNQLRWVSGSLDREIIS